MSKWFIIKSSERNLCIDITRISSIDYHPIEGFIDVYQNGRHVYRIEHYEKHIIEDIYNSLLSKMQKLEEANNEKDNVQR